jgi:hypothetical protein
VSVWRARWLRFNYFWSRAVSLVDFSSYLEFFGGFRALSLLVAGGFEKQKLAKMQPPIVCRGLARWY